MESDILLREVQGSPFLVTSIIKVLAVFTFLMVTVALLTLLERKVSAWMQDRLGPNRVGPGGIGQPLADGIKNILKEETLPGESNRVFFVLAPMLSIIPALVTFAVIPFAAPLPTRWGVVQMVVADLPIGVLFLLAFSSLGVYGIVMAGWASSNKYALLGGLRAGAQMISYEIALGLSLMSVFFLVGNVTLTGVVATQQAMDIWFFAPLAVSFVFFWISSFAETNRLPFDLPEAESELVTGYHTEYSSMKFSMFFIAEYAHVLTVSALMATLFLGGWDIPFWGGDDMAVIDGVVVGGDPHWLITIATFGMFAIKTFFFIIVFMLVRWTVPRFRYDQVMDLGWKVLLPAALVAVVVTAATVLGLDSLAGATGDAFGPRLMGVAPDGGMFHPGGWDLGWIEIPVYGLVLTAVNVVMLGVVVWLVDRGRAIEGTGAPAERQRMAREAARRRAVQLSTAPTGREA